MEDYGREAGCPAKEPISSTHLDYYGMSSRSKLFFRLAQQTVAVDPVTYYRIVHPTSGKTKGKPQSVPQGSPQNRPTVVTSKPANESGLGLSCFTPPPPEEASLFSCANSVDRI